jgi:hypothetical protein
MQFFLFLSRFHISETFNVFPATVTFPYFSSALCSLLQKLWMEATLHMEKKVLHPSYIPLSALELQMSSDVGTICQSYDMAP